jgi:hypothetical protein
MNAASLLRPALLQGVSLLVATPSGLPASSASPGVAVAQGFSELGARVCACLPDGQDEAAIDREVLAAADIDMLVVDGAGLFAHDASGALRTCLDSTWNVTRAVVNHAFLPAQRGGRIVYLAPRLNAGEHAQAARAGLENLARTLSVEWARHHINVVTIAPGSSTDAEEVVALVAYLASPAGAYFSGCLLDLDTIAR